MHYLDNSATTKPHKEVINIFNKYGFKHASEKDLTSEKEYINKILKCDQEIIYTSGSSESNNLAIKGIAKKYKKGHIISTKTEHSSVLETLNYLEKQGYTIDYVDLVDGIVDINHLKKLINKDTILVTISSVNSETGIIQPIEKIKEILNEKNICFHCDMTQSIGKINIDLDGIDLVSISSHKLNGLKGIACLLKRKDLDIVPLFYGKQIYNLGLIKSFSYILSVQLKDVDKKYEHMKNMKELFVSKISSLEDIHINSTDNSTPYIISISIKGVKPETFLHKLEEYDVYISTKSACSISDDISNSVYLLTNNLEYAKTSLRFSFSSDICEKDIIYATDAVTKAYDYFKEM